MEEPEGERRGEDDDDEDDFQEAVHPERPADPVADPAADGRADRHPPEEAGQDGRHGLRRVAEHEDELAGPDDLVDEPGRAGQDEDRDDRPAPRHRAVSIARAGSGCGLWSAVGGRAGSIAGLGPMRNDGLL